MSLQFSYLLSKQQILDLSKMKAIADKKKNVTWKLKIKLGSVENGIYQYELKFYDGAENI